MVARAAQELADQRRLGARVKEPFAAHRGAAGLDEITIGNGLQHISCGTRLQRLVQVALVLVHRSIRIRNSGRRRWSALAACSPVILGIEMSRIARSMSVASARRNASAPSPASANTSRSGSPSSTSRRPGARPHDRRPAGCGSSAESSGLAQLVRLDGAVQGLGTLRAPRPRRAPPRAAPGRRLGHPRSRSPALRRSTQLVRSSRGSRSPADALAGVRGQDR